MRYTTFPIKIQSAGNEVSLENTFAEDLPALHPKAITTIIVCLWICVGLCEGVHDYVPAEDQTRRLCTSINPQWRNVVTPSLTS